MHARIAERIAKVAKLAPSDVVVEIGPGTGMLTRELLKRARKVIAIEADYELCEKLKVDFSVEIAENHLDLIHADIRDYPLNTAIAVKKG
jgi:16S rRNA A1518/A1519 N6-dimethyltransferase RsmA/KsgA/DIM1 with predicted DNA glycosylase/AP lyase activity